MTAAMVHAVPNDQSDQTATPPFDPEPGAAPRIPALDHQHSTGCYWDLTGCCWSCCKDGAHRAR